MGFTHSQKKYLKKNFKHLSLDKIANNLGKPKEEILLFLKKTWPREKYEKFLNQTKPPPDPLKAKSKKIFALLAVLVFVVYANSLGNDFVSDDLSSIRDNRFLANFSTIFSSKPPFVSLNNFINSLTYNLFGLNPISYRFINIIFHLGSSYLVYLLADLSFSPSIALIAASFFAAHPISTEAVSWISGSPYSISGFFFLLSLINYFFWIKNKKNRFYFNALSSFLLAFFSSEKVLVLPIVLVIVSFLFHRLKNDLIKITPFFLISIFWGLNLFGLIGTRVRDLETIHYQTPTPLNPLVQIPIAVASYLQLIFWPKDLTLYHSEMVFSQLEYFLHFGLFAFFIINIIYLYFSPQKRWLSFWLSFFVIALSPTLTPFGVSWIVAERYVYLGSIGILVVLAYFLDQIKNNRVKWVVFILMVIALSTRTFIRNLDWRNQDTLWLATAKTSPSSPQNHNNLGDLYGRRGDLSRAVEEFKKAIELMPNYADAYHNLANTYQQMGQKDLAIENYQQALKINPRLWQSHQNLAAIYYTNNQLDQAKKELEQALAIVPDNQMLKKILLQLDSQQTP